MDEEHFRADAHGLGMWSLAVVLGLGQVALMAAAGLGEAVKSQAQPTAYWADKLLTGAPMTDYAARNDEVSRLLTADMIHAGPSSINQAGDDRGQLVSLVSAQNGMPPPVAEQRIEAVENGIRAEADTARHAALYLAMWSAFALLFGGFAAVTSTVMARWHAKANSGPGKPGGNSANGWFAPEKSVSPGWTKQAMAVTGMVICASNSIQ